MLFLTVLFFLLWIPLLFPALASPDAQEYDYVDNNTSNVDGVADLGTHSNFTAQQYGPDSIYDTVTEENTGGGGVSIVLESYSIYESTVGATSHTVDKPSGVVEGDLLIAVMSTDGSGEDHTAPLGWTTIFEDFNTGSSTFSVWYKIAATEPDSYTFTIGSSESCILSILRISGHDPTNPINVYGSPDSNNNNAPTCSSVTTTVDNCLILRIFGADDDDVIEDSGYPSGHTGVFIRGSEEGWGETSAGVAYTKQATAGETGIASFSLTSNEQWGAVTIAIKPTAQVNYEFDLEVQWTNANYTLPNEELCIFGGTLGSEDIQVDVWNGSTWHNLFIDLSSGWNNVSVTDYLVSSTFSIRFMGGTETGDTSQDSWEIDCTLLHTWGVPPIASFFYAPDNPYTGETITFNASGSYDPDGTIVNYLWSFGDGTNGTDMVTTHTYADDGTYTVILTVTDNNELSNTTAANVTVLNRSPIAIFTESAENAYIGEPITLNASDSYDLDGTIASYYWDFGDGTNATGVVVNHVYATNGTYTVTLTVTDDDGAINSANSTKTILKNEQPVASFSESAETVYTDETIIFNASSSYDPDGIIVSYFWDFGDGTNGTGVTVNHVYTDDGNYTVTLTVTDNRGATDSTNATKTILNRSPLAGFTESAETAYTSDAITFNASLSYDPDGYIVSYFWDFGDGSNATEAIVEHAYIENGTYIVTLTVTDDDGATNSAASTKTVWNRPPIAFFIESTETAYTNEIIIFNASDSYDPDGTVVSYFWDFGDGTNATGVVVDHAYAEDGNYTVSLLITDDDEATASTSATKTVLNTPPVASFTESAEIVYTSETIAFNASNSYDSDGAIVSYFWDFGDGTNITGVVVGHAFVDNGNYTVTLTITDDDGATGTVAAVKTVLNRPPIASFTESVETVDTGEFIMFNASDSYDPDGSIVSYFWDFGDGNNATGVIVEHAYADDGTYVVTLTVTDDDGTTDTTTSIKTALNRLPVTSFSETAETVYTGETITFNASSSYDPDGTIVSYFWSFGDGTNATGEIVEHAYENDGNYTVTLTATDDDGATDSTTSTKTVLNRPPVALFTESAETVYAGEIITFNASNSYDSDGTLVSYFWDFGDGKNGTSNVINHVYADDGIYTVTLKVTDDDGGTDSSSATKTVLNRPPIATFTESAATVYKGEIIYFNASDSYDPDGSIISYFWDFGDGANATGVTVEHTYANDGSYTVTLTVTDNDGATDTTSATKTILNRLPVAIFTESTETAYIGEIITFNASDSYDPDGYIVTYFWDFGDGTNTTGIIADHIYSTNGTYIVTLTVNDDDGASDSIASTKTILRNEPPAAIYTESAETVYTAEIIYFNASDSYDSDGYIVSYFWDFGDTVNATGITVNHAYVDDGIYTVTLTVTDNRGAASSTNATKTILNRAAIALFTESAETVYTSEAITFNATESYDPDGTILEYFWDFGDGTNGTGIIVEHSYTDNGSYMVTLTITDDDSATSTATATKTVLNRPPVASFTESAETLYTGEFITFNASESYDPDGSIASHFWDFGDGTNATGVVVDHAYAEDIIYTVTLTVTDDDGATDSAFSTKTILNRSPVASFIESAETVYNGEIITFNASVSYDADGYIVSYFWDFGDGTNATGVVVEHAYVDHGNYTVTLIVTDDDGAFASATATKTVLNRPPVASFTESAETAYTGEVVLFNASNSYDQDGIIVSYFWDFGNGNNVTGVVVEYAYADDGDYTVTLIVTDDDGATGTATATKHILNRSPVASFTESAETVYTYEVITFNTSSSYDPDGTIVSCFWDFGDGTNATGVVVQHAYANNGNYTVTLIVTDDDGTTDSTSAIKAVLNRLPVASFTESSETAYTNEIIYFNASDSYDSDGTIVGYFWDFGDDTNATGTVVEHAYVEDSVYTVVLTVTDDDGASSSTSSTKTVLNRPPVASFTESAETVYTHEIITFNASDSYDPDGYIVDYFWDLGDGANATGMAVSHAYTDEGVYSVTLTVTDSDGATALANATKAVLNRPPVALFTESAEIVLTGETITFNASGSYDSDGYIVDYFWDFGDETNATGMITMRSYVDDGTYTVTLTVTDDDGASISTSSTKTVLNRPPVPSFDESAETVYTGEIIAFNASDSYDPDGYIVSYFWDFGDETNTSGIIVEHAYANDGIYTVVLTVTDDDGTTDTATSTKTVLNRAPVASFAESAETVYTGEVITLNASGSYDPDGSIVSYFWDFGDGTNAAGVIVDHSYVDNGTYTVAVTVTDDDGVTDTTISTKTVLNMPPVALFTESAETVYTSEVIAFNASNSYDLDGLIVIYFWDFGDGTNATGTVVEHAYEEDGVYTVTLSVTDNDGAISSTSAIKTVLNKPPVASFTESAETVLTGEIITFDAFDSYDPDGTIVLYFWNFGDGTNTTGLTIGHSYADDGNYTIILTVTDNDGTTAIATAIKTVLNRSPVAIFTPSATAVYTSQIIHFDGSGSYDSDGVIAEYFWNFGDGENATGVVVEHTYADDGIYIVTLTVTDDDGAIGVATATIQVFNRIPIASFTESAETVYTSETITFNASLSYDPDGYIVSYFWDFGDGTNTSGIIVEHAYADDGIYTVTLTITDNDGATDTTTETKTVLNRPPVASFTESAETVLIDEVIRFNASNSYDPDGTIASYFWNFGDGTNATGVTTQHAYSSSGVYIVTLTVTDVDGAIATATGIKTVEVTPPVALFTESAETVQTEEIITFNASDSYDPDGTIVSYFWNFGDVTNATGVTTSHSYADNGNYTVTLTITDDDGATATATSTKTVLNRPPVALFTESAETVQTGEIIYFNASGSYDPDGYIISYFWDFGDSANATGVTVEYAYGESGTYIVTMTVTDDDGANNIVMATKHVGNTPPVASFTESAEIVYTGETISFDASDSNDPDGTIVSYFWGFGDGTNATGVTTSHSYADNGNYTVTLTITDDDGATATASAVKTVLNRAPIAKFTQSATLVYTGTPIYFNASDSYDRDGIIIEYFWNFGDGSNATGIVVGHAYTNDGNYTVTLTVTDDDGAMGMASGTTRVLNRAPIAIFTESVETVYTNEIIYFNASGSYDPDGYIISYFWNLGDGTNATGITIGHIYSENGNYTVTLTVTDNDGATGSTASTKVVLNRAPIASFTESVETIYTGESITFNASDSYDVDGTVIEYFWDFGDGTNATGVVVSHSYIDNGNFTVTLIVTDDDDATNSASAIKTVLNRAPVALFTESAESVHTEEIITFNASDSYDPDGTIVSYFWNFGDGTNATGMIVGHAHTEDGNYTVTLTVTDDDGAADNATSTKTVLNKPPVASFTESSETVYIGQPIIFNASDSYDLDGTIISYFWDFGDGTNATSIVVEHTYFINGTYTVTLTVSDDDDASDATSATKTILWNEQPVALFTESAETVYTDEIIYFNASDSYDSDGNIASYFWDFGDGSNATGVVAEHAYTEDGNYTLTLTVTDNKGATNTATATKAVLNKSPVASFTESAEIVYTSEVIDFNATDSYDPDGYIVEYFWDFGDGTNATGLTISHSYKDNGTYIVILTVTDDDDAYNSTTATKTALNSPPVAAFSESAETTYTSQPITFNASNSYDPDGYIASYFWDFGDGTNATGIVAEHAYSTSGNFTVMLNVTDNEGNFGVSTATKTILWNEPPVALFTESAETFYQGETIIFNASDSYDLDGTIVSYFWDFGDGSNATDMIVEHIYLDHGNYTVMLIVTDDIGATNTANATKTVLNKIPVVTFTESTEAVYTDEVITFNASASYDPDGFIVSYFWDFGDGMNAVGVIVEHAYAEDGSYTVTLTMTDDDGATNSASATKTVLNRSPVAIFSMSTETVYTGETITFNASDSYDPDGFIVIYFWDFGDGDTASGLIVNHAYSDNGRYVVALTVTDNDAAKDTATATFLVRNRSPIASFVESAETTFVGIPIEFDASSSYDSDGYVVSYFWDFGDGANATGIVAEHAYSVNGTFTVTLTVTDDSGALNSAQAVKTILENDLPIASFTESAETVYASEPIVFDASSSYDPDGSIVSYFWDFGDGTGATDIITSHSYVDNGNYTVTLMVLDDRGASGFTTTVKSVLNRPPIASFTESAETVYAGESISFDASSSYDPDGSIVSYFWDFGDEFTTSGVIVNHVYSTNGTFIVTLTVVDDDGASGLTQATKNLLPGGMHDVAVINVTPAASDVYKGRILNTTVTALNQGTVPETFNVTLYYSEIRGWHLVETDGRLVWYSDVDASANFLLLTSVNIPSGNSVLAFDTKYDIEFLWDFGFVQVSRDEGITWVSLENAYTTYDHESSADQDIITNLPGLTGTSPNWPEWMTMTFNLTDYAGETVLLGFRYMTDAATLGEGWYIDNIRVNGDTISDQDFEQSNPLPTNAIQTLTVTNLAPDGQTTLIFSWNTTGILSGKYALSATADAVAGEVDTSDNTYVNSIVEVKRNPDVNGDGLVDIYDVVAVTGIYGCREGEAGWNPKADVVQDGVINIYDVVAVTGHYGETIQY